MLDKPTISIIIPVYNRATLLPETLDSILAQTFSDWECILVDDGSADASLQVMREFQQRDSRIKAFSKPAEVKKGANSCRNFGFTKSTGLLVKWFDSDDIMLPKHLEIAIKKLEESNSDFVVTDSLNFDHSSKAIIGPAFYFDKENVLFSPENVAWWKIGWITDDFLGKRELVQKVKFNESITDGDEYNFFVRLLHHSVNGNFINTVLSHRRIHKDSITVKNTKNNAHYLSIIATLKFQTAKDLELYNNTSLIKWFLRDYMRICFELVMERGEIPYQREACKMIAKYFSFSKGTAFLVSLFLAQHLKKGYIIMKYARQ